jgi:transposase
LVGRGESGDHRRDPQLYLTDVLTRIADHPARQIAELLPWNWLPREMARAA